MMTLDPITFRRITRPTTVHTGNTPRGSNLRDPRRVWYLDGRLFCILNVRSSLEGTGLKICSQWSPII